MTAYVLLGLRNAELLIGYRVMFTDPPSEKGWRFLGHDGWLLEHPEAGPFKWYMNRKGVEKEFEVLGEI